MVRALLPALLLALAACGAPQIVKPYRMEIQQGNYVSQEMVSQLKPGMTKDQVRFVLGTPLVTDIFHADRWDYVYYREVQGGAKEQRRIAVLFEDGKLVRVVGDIVAAEPKPETPGRERPAAKPEGPPAKAEVPAAKPAAEPAPVQNWRAASDAPAAQEPKREEAKPEARKAEAGPAEEKPEKGFFGRMLDRIRGKDQ